MGAGSSKEEVNWEERAKVIGKLIDGVPAEGTGDFFNRKKELAELCRWLSVRPSNVRMVVGPNDCGKSCLLRRLQELWNTQEYLVCTSPIFYVDMRRLSWKSPADAAAHLISAFRGWADTFQRWADRVKSSGTAVTFKIPGVLDVQMDNIMEAFLRGMDQGQQSDLASVMMRFANVVDANPMALPIFILDEADRLKTWGTTDLKTLTGCFLSLGKQDRRAYVILCSSDDFFRGWLKDMFSPSQWDPFGVGCFGKDEARQYFVGHCFPRAVGDLPKSFEDSDWEDVYQVCGGSPLLLRLCAETTAGNNLSWKESAEGRLRNCLSQVESGLDATIDSHGFDGQKYRAIANIIVEKGVVGVRAVKKHIYSKDGPEFKQQLMSMLRGNFIHVRYVTPLTKYADISLSEVGVESELIMARSPAERAAMKWYFDQEKLI